MTARGGELSPSQVQSFSVYLEELARWNSALNITAIEGEKETVVKHFIDSLSPLPYLPREGFILDIGSGGGFPGLPLKICRPSLRVLLLDSSHKKIVFLKNLIRRLGLKGVEALAQRAEARGFQEVMQETAHAVVSRAVFSLDAFCPIGAPFLRSGGRLISMRGRCGDHGAGDTRGLREGYGLILEKVEELSLPLDMGRRTLVVLRKV